MFYYKLIYLLILEINSNRIIRFVNEQMQFHSLFILKSNYPIKYKLVISEKSIFKIKQRF